MIKGFTLIRGLVFVALLVVTVPSYSGHRPLAEESPTTPATAHRVQVLKDRLEEIRAMDMKELSRKERKALRREVRVIRQELTQISGGVYLSVGAIILIVLLILLLA